MVFGMKKNSLTLGPGIGHKSSHLQKMIKKYYILLRGFSSNPKNNMLFSIHKNANQ